MLGSRCDPGARSSRRRNETAEKEVRIVGCVQWEKDYRKERNEGRGGAIGTGIGAGNEFVLTFAQLQVTEEPGASIVTPEMARESPTTYSITGDREKELGRRIGQQVEVIGMLEDAGKADSERFGDLPRIKMTAWVPIKDSCPAQ